MILRYCRIKEAEHFALARLPHGLEVKSLDRLVDYVKDDEEAVRMVQGEMGAAKPHGANQHTKDEGHYNVMSSNPDLQGNSATYLLRRLKRDAPAVAEAYLAGEHKSVRAAAKTILEHGTPKEIKAVETGQGADSI